MIFTRRDICLFYKQSVPIVFDAYVAAARDRFDKECHTEPYYELSFGLNFSLKYNMNGGACTIRFMPYNGGTAVNSRYSIAQGAAARYEAHNRDLTKVVENRLGCSAEEVDIDVEEFLKPQNWVVAQPIQPAYEIAGTQIAPNNIQFSEQVRQSAQHAVQPTPQPAPQPMPQAAVEYRQSEQPAYEIAGTQTAPNNIQFSEQARQSAQHAVQPIPQPAPQPVVQYEPQPSKPAYETAPQPEQPTADTEAQTESKVDFCINCGSILRANAKFCSACGKSVEPPKCPDCGETVEENDNFCFNCGKKLK